MRPMEFRKTEPELRADISDLRARLAALVEAAEAMAVKCSCGEPATYTHKNDEYGLCEKCAKNRERVLGPHCYVWKESAALWSAINRAKGVM